MSIATLAIYLGTLILGSTSVRAGSSEGVIKFPASRLIELRARLQAELRGDTGRQPIDRLINLGVGRSGTGLIAVEEASKFLDDVRAGTEGRIRRVMGLAERILDETTLNEVERVTLRGYLDLHLRCFTAHRPRAALQMLYRHHLWDADHLPYILSQIEQESGRQWMYRALVDLRAKLGHVQMRVLIHQLRAKPPQSIEHLAMLDEFDHLDPESYARLIKRLQMSFCADGAKGGTAQSMAQEIRLRAVTRIQARVARQDPATLWALRKAAGKPGSAMGELFFHRLARADFAIEMSPETFGSADPLSLHQVPSSNVVTLGCARRLDRAR